MSRSGPGFLINLFHWMALTGFDVLFHVLNRTRIWGKEHIPGRGERRILFLCNHISALDPFLIGSTAVPRFSPVWWQAAAKEELFRTPFLRWFMALIGAFPVRRGRHDPESMERMVEAIGRGVLVVFPEGTWSETGELLPGRLGVGRVIYRARPLKIIPVAVQGTDRILPRGKWLPRVGQKAEIRIGSPLNLSRLYHQKDSPGTHREIVEAVMGQIQSLSRKLSHP